MDSARVPLVDMRDISLSFGGIHAVERASIDLYDGEVVGLVGHNGAGKSPIRVTPRHTASRRSTRRWRWPTMSTPPPIFFSAASCGHAGARSTTSPWRPARATSWAG